MIKLSTLKTLAGFGIALTVVAGASLATISTASARGAVFRPHFHVDTHGPANNRGGSTETHSGPASVRDHRALTEGRGTRNQVNCGSRGVRCVP
jgi:hypothetical protein